MNRTAALVTALSILLAAGCSTSAPEGAAKPEPAKAEAPPERYKVEFDTSKGTFQIEVIRDWAPRGADRFHQLVRNGYFDDTRFYRVLRNYIVQFGLSADPSTTQMMAQLKLQDDPRKESNRKGTVTFAHYGPNSRTTQVFINLRDNTSLDKDGFTPFGRVIEGMDVVEQISSIYGDWPPRGSGPDQARIVAEGNVYLDRNFPRLDKIKAVRFIP
ncbi:MAG: peptidylprolyl isomerase [Bryobacteraceae bacterium]